MCRSQQVSEVPEESEGSEEECDQISENFGSYFINWSTAKVIMDKSNKARFISSDKLNLTTKFVDYNKQPICALWELKTNLRSAGWVVKGTIFLVMERKTRCTMGLDLRRQVEIVTTQKPAPKELSSFDVLMCEQSEG